MVRTGETRRIMSSGAIVSMRPLSISVGITGNRAPQMIGAHFGFPGGPRPRWYMGFSTRMKSATQRLMDEHVQETVRAAAARLRRAG